MGVGVGVGVGVGGSRPPPPTLSAAPPPPPRLRGQSTATRVNNPGRPQGRAALSPGAPPTAQPIRCGTPPGREQHHLCQCNYGVWAAPSQVQGLAAPMPQAVVGWPAARQLTWRWRVQANYSPCGRSVRRRLPPCRGLEHHATNPPTRPPPPPQTQGTPAARTPHTQARRYVPPACATAGFGGCPQSGTP